MKHTYDGQPVYPANAELPSDAEGWTLCRLRTNFAYSVWLASQDQARSRATLTRVEKEAHSIRTRKEAARQLEALGSPPYGTLCDMRRLIAIKRYALAWPLKEAE